MLKNIAWNTFKQTGDINTFLEFLETEKMEGIISGVNDGSIKDKGNNNFRK